MFLSMGNDLLFPAWLYQFTFLQVTFWAFSTSLSHPITWHYRIFKCACLVCNKQPQFAFPQLPVKWSIFSYNPEQFILSILWSAPLYLLCIFVWAVWFFYLLICKNFLYIFQIVFYCYYVFQIFSFFCVLFCTLLWCIFLKIIALLGYNSYSLNFIFLERSTQ